MRTFVARVRRWSGIEPQCKKRSPTTLTSAMNLVQHRNVHQSPGLQLSFGRFPRKAVDMTVLCARELARSLVMVRLASLAVAASLTSCACASFIDDTINALKLPLSSEKLTSSFQHSRLTLSSSRALRTSPMELVSLVQKDTIPLLVSLKETCTMSSSLNIWFCLDYVATIAKLAGYDVQRQTFPHEYSEVLTQKFVANAPININAMTYSPSTPLGGITVPLVLIPDPDAAPSAGCTPADFASVDAKGKIALIQRGGCNFAIKNENAKNAGAVGVVVYNNVEGAISGTLGASNPTAYVPIGGITKAEGETLAQRLSSGQPISATLDINIFVEQRYSSNVIATSKAGNQSNIVFIGSHLDSVTAGAGINDNGSGQ
ncbi:PA domain-containing protein [Rhizoctonia solani AG-1 IA]|uniref:Peptide hydrolase n=1 Tax=Thanatephorus cucumeris (strain AG1-IA) TaxID=983506 RepID=L8WV23_THACA|nr:PA domain-containing protein [Rhizoctonia solani AG-1 IA]